MSSVRRIAACRAWQRAWLDSCGAVTASGLPAPRRALSPGVAGLGVLHFPPADPVPARHGDLGRLVRERGRHARHPVPRLHRARVARVDRVAGCDRRDDLACSRFVPMDPDVPRDARVAAAPAGHGRRRAPLRLPPSRHVRGRLPRRDGAVRRRALVVGDTGRAGRPAARRRGRRAGARLLGLDPNRQLVRVPVPVRGDPDDAVRRGVLPGRPDADAGTLARLRVAAVARGRAVSLRHPRPGQHTARLLARRLPRPVGGRRVLPCLPAIREEADGLMVTTYLAPRLINRATSVAGRVSAVTARDLIATRHSGYWLVVVSGFLEPVLYLFSIGIGVGGLVGDFHLADGTVVGYASFVAPAMLAASAMNGAMAESTFNFFGRLKWAKLYDAMVATPLRPFEIALGELSWALIRGSLYSIAFLVLMVGLDLTSVGRAIPALFAALLIGLAFGAAGMAITTMLRTWQDFDYIFVVSFGMFLFSGTFAPVDSYPSGLQYVVEATPLYQGVALLRGLTTGIGGWDMAVNALYLVAMTSIGLWVASRRMGKLLCK